MKKLLGITLAVMLLFGLIASPVTAAPTFTQITQPDAAYKASTTKIDISGLTYGASYSSITDGALTVNFSSPLRKLGPVPTGWATWSSPPWSESANPHVLYRSGTSLTMTLSQPVTTFGFELEPNPFINVPYKVDFILMSGPTVVGTISMTIHGYYGARLIAASITDGSVDKIVIKGDRDFAIAQVRYALLVDIDIKPMSDPNSINLKSKGVIPVAVLTTPDFDATTVDGETVMFAGASPVHDMSDPAVVADHQHDVDGDGDMDFVFHFRVQDTDIAAGDTSATLTGKTLGGIPISGSDSVRTVPPE